MNVTRSRMHQHNMVFRRGHLVTRRFFAARFDPDFTESARAWRRFCLRCRTPSRHTKRRLRPGPQSGRASYRYFAHVFWRCTDLPF